MVVGMLRVSLAWTREHEPLLRRCASLVKFPGWEVRITHCYRETNQVADKLANMGVELDLRCNTYHSPPCAVRDLVFADNVGVSWPRLIRNK